MPHLGGRALIAFDLGLIAYTERYLLARSVSSDYAATLRARVARFCVWCGADVTIDSLSPDLVNEWITELEAGGMNKWTLSGHRQNLLAVWNHAYLAGDNDNAPNRLRKVKKPRLIIEAFTHEELHALIAAAAKLTGLHADDNRAADFWQAAIHTAYSCGARRGDVLNLEWKHVAPSGRLTFLQNKTQFTHTVQLSKEALYFAGKLTTTGRVLPWPYEANWFGVTFKRLQKAAGVKRGSWRWIRRSAGSYAERENPGAGARLLGHRDGRVFKRHYEDGSISGEKPDQPPPL